MRLFVLLLATLAVSIVPGRAQEADPCEVARCALQASLAECNCATADNHGRYVSCVTHKIREIIAQTPEELPVRCKGKLVRCAARSVCGKPGFVTCNIPVSSCVSGFCANNTTQVCLTDLDCGTRCKIKSSDVRCTAAGGAVGASPTCCSSCVTPG